MRKLYVFRHDSSLGNAPSHTLFEKIHVDKKEEVIASRKFSDYTVTVDTAMPEGVKYNDLPDYDLYGIADCIEFVKDKKGVKIKDPPDSYAIKIIEYKPKPPKDCEYHETDAIQVFAQKVCADYIWGGDAECFVYYSDTKKRVRLPFDSMFEHYDRILKDLLLRKAQFEQFAAPPILLAQNTVAAKVYNTQFLIKRSLRDYPQIDENGEVSKCIEYLKEEIAIGVGKCGAG